MKCLRIISIFGSSLGDLVSQFIACPNCDKKLTLRDELRGRALICPECKGRFTVPIDELADEGFGTISDGTPTPGGSDMTFLDNLATLPGPATAKIATKGAVSPISFASRAAASHAKKKNDQMMMIYIGGGIAAAVLVVILVVVAISSKGGGGKKKDENMRFGLTESERKGLFKDLFHAVDEYGPSKECREEWRRLGSKWSLTDRQISDIRKEGMDRDWEQPAIPATTDQKQKTNRREWVRIMTETHLDPIMSQ